MIDDRVYFKTIPSRFTSTAVLLYDTSTLTISVSTAIDGSTGMGPISMTCTPGVSLTDMLRGRCVCWWVSSPLFQLNVFWQISHSNGFSSLWLYEWFSSPLLVWNLRQSNQWAEQTGSVFVTFITPSTSIFHLYRTHRIRNIQILWVQILAAKLKDTKESKS